MVAIVTGPGLGLIRSSAYTLGAGGQLGNAPLGRANEGVTVNAATGNLIISRHDEVLTSNLDVFASRTYNSLGLLNDDNGDNWRLGLSRHVALTSGTYGAAGSKVTRTDWDGSDLVYDWDAARSAYVSKEGAGAFDTLVLSGSTWTWTDGDTRVVELYDNANSGRITAQKDVDGNTTTFTYGASNPLLVTLATTPLLDKFEMTYVGNNLTKIKLSKYDPPTGNYTHTTTTHYTYDTQNRLIRVDVDFTPADGLITDGNTYWTAYTYTNSTSRLVATVTQKDGTSLTIAYDSVNRVSSLTQLMNGTTSAVTTFAYAIGQTVVTDALGVATTLSYDSQNRLFRTFVDAKPQNLLLHSEALDNAAWTVPTGSVTRTANDPARPLPNGGPATAEKLVFGASGGTLQQVVSDANTGGTAGGTYSGDFWVYSDTASTITIKLIDSVGENSLAVSLAAGAWTLVKTGRTFAANSTNRRVQLIGSANQTVWASQARMRGTSTEDVYVATTTTVQLGNSVGVAVMTQMTYDADGNVIKKSIFDGKINANAGIFLEQETSRYDTNGNLLERVYGDNSAVFYTHGSLNEVLTEARYTGLDANGLADGVAPTGGMVTRYVYDEAANGYADDGAASGDDAAEKHLRFTVSPEGRVTEFRYNGSGQLIATLDFAASTYSGTTWTEAALAAWVANTADKTQVQRTDYAYDWRSNLIQTTTFSITDSTGAGHYGYEWNRVDYTYDMAGRLLTRRSSGYNSVGYEAPLVTESFAYDSLGRMISTSDLYGVTIGIAYNDTTRVDTVTASNQATRELKYTTAGGLMYEKATGADITTSQTDYAYDALGRLRMKTDPLGVKTYYTYDKRNRLTAEIDGDGSMSEFKYDAANRVIATVQYANAVSAANLTALGTVTTNTLVDTIRPAVAAADRWNWTIYDKAGRVIETIDGMGDVAKFDYDGAGRLTLTTRYHFAFAATTINGADGVSGYRTALPTSLTLPTAAPTADRITRNYYDSDGLLIGVAQAVNAEFSWPALTEYVYDKAGRQIETVRYANLGLLNSTWTTGTLAQLKASIAPDAAKDIRTYTLYDGRGRVGATIDGEGNVTRYHYTARGDLDEEIRGNKVNPNPSNPTLASLAGLLLGGQSLERTVYNRNAAGQEFSRVRYLSGGHTETTAYTYDNRGRLLSEAASETVSTEARTATYRYDSLGRLTGQLGGNGSAALAALGGSPSQAAIDTVYATHGTRFVYDAADRLIQKITPDGVGAGGVKTLYYYDADGQLRYGINALGEVVEHRYSMLGSNTETVVYGTRIAAGTLATLTGGLVGTAINNAVAAIASASLDSRSKQDFDANGQVTYFYNPNYWTNATIDNYGVIGYNSFRDLYFHYAPAGSKGISGPSVSGNVSIWSNTFYGFDRRGSYDGHWAYLYAPNGTWNGDYVGRYVSKDGLGRVVSFYKNNLFALAEGVKEAYGYDRSDRRIQTTDRLGNSSNVAYDPRSNLISSTDRNNKTTTFSYDPFNRNVTTTTAEGIVSSVKKNAYGQTILITDGKGNTTNYSYDKNGNLKTVTDAAGTSTSNYDNADRLIEVIDAKGVVTRYTYDAANRILTRIVDHGSGKLNLTTTYAYDAKGQQISETDAAGVVTTYQYDLKGQRTRIVRDAGSGRLNLTTDFVYGGIGKVVSQTDGVGTAAERTTMWAYDSAGRLIKQVEDTGGLSLATRYFYDANDNLIATIDALGRTTYYVYDLEDRLALTIDPEGQVAYTGYDKEGRVAWTRQYLAQLLQSTLAQLPNFGNNSTHKVWLTATMATNGDLTVVKRSYDAGVITSTTAATLLASANDRITRSFYDGDGRAVYAVDGEGYVTQNVYDKADNVIQTIRYTLKTTTLTNTSTAANVAALFTTTLSPSGGLATNIPTDAAVTIFAYDAANRLTDVTDAEGVVTHYVLDALGQITETHVAYGTGDVSITKRVFDNVGRVTSETRAFGQAEAVKTNFAYDALSRVTQIAIEDADGTLVNRTYDAVGRMLTEARLLQGSTYATTAFEYDARGNVVKVTDPRGNVTWSYYDALDRLVLRVDPEGYVVKTEYVIGSVIWKVTRYANAASNLASLSATVQPTVTANAAADAVTLFEYDKTDRVTKVTDAEGGIEQYAYDALGNRISVTNQLDGVIDYAYDRSGLLKTEKVNAAVRDDNGNQLATFVTTEYVYDSRGNVKEKKLASNLATLTQTIVYDYDKLDRLTKQTDPSIQGQVVETRYDYDKRGNVLLVTAADGGKTFSKFDRLDRKIAEISPVGTYSEWSYDDNGNVKSRKVWSGSVALPANATAAWATPTGTARETQFVYDRGNRMIEARVLNVRTGAFDGTNYVTATGQTLTSTNQYDAAGNLIRETDARGNLVYHWYDKTGRETAKLDQEGFLTTWSRDADGNVLIEKRFATQYTGSVTAGGAVPTVAADNVNDRRTDFTYDKMGRRLTESRLFANGAVLNGYAVSPTGVLSVDATKPATVTYAYNALGQVKSKQESTGDKTDYQYDNQGRLERQLGAVATDFNANGTSTVRYATYFYYDPFGNLARSVEKAEAGTSVPGTAGTYAAGYSSADDRISRYTYTAINKLVTQTDATLFVTNFAYDQMGRTTNSWYTRTKSDGTTVTEGNLVSYDAAGRVTAQWQATTSGPVPSTWTLSGVATKLTYNAYGEVTAKALTDNLAGAGQIQEQFEYDKAGRAVKTTAGDGAWKVMAYDANGNATLTLTSHGYDLGANTEAAAIAAFLANNATIAGTIVTYDKRNMALSSREPNRTVADANNPATTITATLIRSQSYNAFGEVGSETDARGYTTHYTYNTMGRVLRSEAPTISITNEDGASQWVRPATDYYYDASGRLVATRDANGAYATGGTAGAGTSKAANTGNLTTRQLLGGTGYGGSEALALKEFRADGSVWESRYDAFGGQRVSIDGLLRTTTQTTDKAGRVTQITRPTTAAGTLIEDYAYDGLGRRIKAWNNLYGSGQAARTDYDAQGRVTSQIAQGGDAVTTSYVWNGALANTGLGLTGGWIETATYANSKTIVTKSDSFGRELEKTDMGNHVFAATYDKAGRLLTRGNQTYTWYNTGLLASASGDFGTETYTYDQAGNRRRELLVNAAVTRKDATAQYDAMGWMTQWAEAATATHAAASTTTSYDAQGNIRKTAASFSMLDAYGNAGAPTTRDYWFRYDALGRVVVDKGSLDTATNTIVKGTDGTAITYDANGNRATMQRYTQVQQGGIWRFQPTGGGPAQYWSYREDLTGGTWTLYTHTFFGEQLETYAYDTAGHLLSVTIANSQLLFNDGDIYLTVGGIGGGLVRSSFAYDLAGRMTQQSDLLPSAVVSFSRTVAYNAKNQVTSDDSTTLRGTDTFRSVVTYDYGSGAAYALGAALTQTADTYKNGNDGDDPDTLTTTAFAWYDGAVQSTVTHDSDTGTFANPIYTTTFTLNALGQVASAVVNDGIAKTMAYQLDAAGQIIRRDETRTAIPGQAAPHEVFYRFAGKQMGMSGNNGTVDVSYHRSIAERAVAPPPITSSTAGLFRDGTNSYAGTYADFSQSVEQFNTAAQGSSGGTYTVRSGDSLASIAQGMWGDASLWFKLAEANGLSGNASLAEGQNLILPAGVTKHSHNAATLKPYDAIEALGDTQPTTPKPPKKPKCGVFGAILLAVVAIAVSALATAGTVSLFSGKAFGAVLGSMFGGASVGGGVATWAAAGAIGGATGSIASQGLGVLTGIQESINWKAVGMAGISGAIGGAFQGLSQAARKAGELAAKTSALSGVNSSAVTAAKQAAERFSTGVLGFLTGQGTVTTVARAALVGRVTSGLGKLARLQDEIGWAGIAAAGVGAAAGSLIPGAQGTTAGAYAQNLAGSGVSMLANAATRSVLEGTSFGDNVIAALPDVIGQTIGNMIVRGVSEGTRQASARPQRITDGNGDEVILGGRIPDALVAQNQALADEMFAASAGQTWEMSELTFAVNEHSPRGAAVMALLLAESAAATDAETPAPRLATELPNGEPIDYAKPGDPHTPEAQILRDKPLQDLMQFFATRRRNFETMGHGTTDEEFITYYKKWMTDEGNFTPELRYTIAERLSAIDRTVSDLRGVTFAEFTLAAKFADAIRPGLFEINPFVAWDIDSQVNDEVSAARLAEYPTYYDALPLGRARNDPPYVSEAAAPRIMRLSLNGANFIHGGEGFEPGLYYPIGTGSGSGVTLGFGYDFGYRSPDTILADLTAIGVPEDAARTASQGSGLKGTNAIAFANRNAGLISISEDQANQLFIRTLARYEDLVRSNVRVPLNQNQFDALVSLAYNVEAAVRPGSDVIENINNGNLTAAADHFLDWNKARSGGGSLQVVPGLTDRRHRERELFLRSPE